MVLKELMLMGMVYHIAKNGSDKNTGTAESPFLTINRAAALAEEGYTVIVHEGVYRECVNPSNSARCSAKRITYRAADGEKVIIKGSEEIKDWERVSESVWRVRIENGFFGAFNPYIETIDGDWLMEPVDKLLHLGQVYLNSAALRENTENSLSPMEWYTEQDGEYTVIYADFGGSNPNDELTEINVRRSCFYPELTGINYITVSGFEFAHAACPWAPPTADQPGMVSAHWSKGWIIENNIMHDAKCSAVSLGKEISTGHNLYTRYHRKSGYRHQLETVFMARHIGWDKERIGSHIVRNNTIYNCGQNGIVGHMGGAFSEIYGNHIYNIGNLHEFFGYEIAGIKLHAAIDTHIHHNYIHDCRLGLWLDWEAQGTRVSSNLFHSNERDMFIEVTHGPHIVDNNIFASEHNFCNAAQGGAYVHNLFAGSTKQYQVLERSTPYHLPHSTEVMGTAATYSYDDRILGNIFGFTSESEDGRTTCGTHAYNGCPVSMEEYITRATESGRGDIEKYLPVKQCAYIDGNCYLGGAEGFEREESSLASADKAEIKISEEADGVYLEITLPDDFNKFNVPVIKSYSLEIPRITEAPYEAADGSEIVFDTDYNGNIRENTAFAGPLQALKSGYNKVKVWG